MVYRIKELALEKHGPTVSLDEGWRVLTVLDAHRATESKWYVTVVLEKG